MLPVVLQPHQIHHVHHPHPQVREPAAQKLGGGEPASFASALEFVLEGLHLSKRLNKDAVGAKATYRGRG